MSETSPFNKPAMVKSDGKDIAAQIDSVASSHKAQLEHQSLQRKARQHAHVVLAILEHGCNADMTHTALTVAASLLLKLGDE